MCTCAYTHTHTHMHTILYCSLLASTHSLIKRYACKHIHKHTYTHVHTHTHTHKHTPTNPDTQKDTLLKNNSSGSAACLLTQKKPQLCPSTYDVKHHHKQLHTSQNSCASFRVDFHFNFRSTPSELRLCCSQ